MNVVISADDPDYNEGDSWGRVAIEVDGQEREIFSGEAYYNQCCGIVELAHLATYMTEKPEEAIAAFHRLIPELGAEARKGVVHLTLNIYEGHESPVQREWFCRAVESYPGVMSLPWVLNPNSGNQIKMFLLPTGIETDE